MHKNDTIDYHQHSHKIVKVYEKPYTIPGTRAIHAELEDGTKELLLYYTPGGLWPDGIDYQVFVGQFDRDVHCIWMSMYNDVKVTLFA